MSIRLIARDLYRLKREAETLEEKIRNTPPERREALEEDLRKARADLLRLQRMLDGAKTPPDYRQPR